MLAADLSGEPDVRPLAGAALAGDISAGGEDAVRNGADTLQQVMDVTGAGKGCGKCKDFLECLIRDIKEEL